MLSKILFSLVCFLLPIILFGQNGSGTYKIYYEMTFRKDSNEAQLTTELSELRVNKDKSMYRAQVKATRDNRAQINEAARRIRFSTEEMRQAAYRTSKVISLQDNNWIELYP